MLTSQGVKSTKPSISGWNNFFLLFVFLFSTIGKTSGGPSAGRILVCLLKFIETKENYIIILSLLISIVCLF